MGSKFAPEYHSYKMTMSNTEDKKVWLITGSSRGIGRVIAETALKQGDQVLASARKTADVQDLVDKYPGQCVAISLDVNNEDSIQAAVKASYAAFGRIDVLINNAGYGLHGVIEEVDMTQVRNQMETNFFGLVSLTQKIIPAMRAQKDGYIFNVSSIAGMKGTPTLGIYNASKFAVEGFTEALAAEVAYFGIKVSLVAPGPYRSDWAGKSMDRSAALDGLDSSSPYFKVNEAWKGRFDSYSGRQPGDPQQIADVLMEASRAAKPPMHMIFGDIAIGVWEGRMKSYTDPDFLSLYPHDKNTL